MKHLLASYNIKSECFSWSLEQVILKGCKCTMTIPISTGWQQLLLFLLAVLGIGLLISAFMGFRREVYIDEHGQRYRMHHRRFRWGRSVSGLLLLILAIVLLWAASLVQSYLGLTGEIKVAHIHATQVTNLPHQMSVELALYDAAGHTASDNTYIMQGDEWMVQGNILKITPWLNIFGLHTGYKLTRLEGRFDDPNLERTAQHTVIELNGGDDNFFKTAYTQKSWITPFVDASYGNAVYQAAGTFDVFATQDALIARPAS